MAEYTMKIELDSSSLAKFEQIVKRMEKITVGGGSAGGGSGFSSTKMSLGKGTADQRKEMQKMFDKLQKFQKDNRLGKFGPGMVKIAGFAIGMAGIVQFRKMLIDSSPMLQAMLTIMNTAITLFLRPIGDMIGFFLKPFVILMLKYGIEFYKKFLEISPKFTDLADKLISGDFLGALIDYDKLRNSIVAAIFGQGNQDGNEPSSLTQQKEIEFAADIKAWEDAIKVAQAKWDLFWNLHWPNALASMQKWLNDVPVWWDENITQPFYNNLGAIGAWFGALPAWFNKEFVQPFLMAWGQLNVFFMVTLPQLFRDIGKHLENFADWIWNSFFKPIIDWLKDKFGFILGGGDSTGSGGGFGNDPRRQSTYDREQRLDETADLFDEIEENSQTSSDAVKQSTTAWEELQRFTTFGVDAGTNAVSTIVNGIGDWGQKVQQALASLGGGGSVGPVQQISPYSYNPGQCGGQHGMLITEPISGVGQKSGRRYQFGESGSERVTPATSSGYGGGGENISVTFNVYGVSDAMDMEGKIKPMFMRWLKESTSMRGIV